MLISKNINKVSVPLKILEAYVVLNVEAEAGLIEEKDSLERSKFKWVT